MQFSTRLGLLLFWSVVACNGDDKEAGDSATTSPQGSFDAGSGTADGVCSLDTRSGRFVVDQTVDYSYADGKLADAVLPTDVLTEVLASGDCRILRRENPFCDPPCAGDETCDLSGTCVAYPSALNVGTVTIRGLSSDVSMEPVEPGNTYFDTSLANPPWIPGDPLSLSASGRDVSPFELHGAAPDTLDGVADQWTLAAGTDLEIAWTPPANDVGTEVVAVLRIDQHGTTPSALECVFSDTGSGVVSAQTMDALIDAGLTGFPAGELRRRTADHANLDNGTCVEFLARSVKVPRVEIEGYTPCRTDAECPEGQECNVELERCE
jgi:hypothetical protein